RGPSVFGFIALKSLDSRLRMNDEGQKSMDSRLRKNDEEHSHWLPAFAGTTECGALSDHVPPNNE
ncbi:hypothetical protein SAMN04488540_107172, partial [Ferrimonas sediminum]